jgi:hypothetical protein
MLSSRPPYYDYVFHHGNFPDGDVVHSAWCGEVRSHLHGSKNLSLTDLEKKSGDGAVMLVCVDALMGSDDLDKIIKTKLDKVLYILPECLGLLPHEAMHYCKEYRLLDVVSGNPATRRWHTDRLEPFVRRLRRLRERKHMYDPVVFGKILALEANRSKCFIATPFESDVGDDFEIGTVAGLEALGLLVNNPRNEFRAHQRITESIREMIDESTIVFANMRQSKRSRFNANVFYEMGYAEGIGKIVLPFRHISDTQDVPVDVRDRAYIPYEDALDVAMQVYWGLKPLVENAVTP